MTTLDEQMRGDEFRYSFALGNDWVESMFTGGVIWTLRKSIPPTSAITANDRDEDVVEQVSTDSGEITFTTSADGLIVIPGSRTKRWPNDVLFWDLQGTVNVGRRIFTIDHGDILILGDITRT